MHYRPWGNYIWMLDHLPRDRWSLLGCLSTEDRCTAAMKELFKRRVLERVDYIYVKDPPSLYSVESNKMIGNNKKTLDAYKIPISDFDLLVRDELLIKWIDSYVSKINGNLIIDISSFPKKFFFPIIKRIIQSNKIKNLLIAYTSAQEYCKELCEDPQPWSNIPLFGSVQYPEPEIEKFIIGVGYLALGLPEIIEHNYNNVDIKLLLPFPPGPPYYQRNWMFIQRLEKNLPSIKRHEPIRVSTRDVSIIYDHLDAETNKGNKYSILAPYGPKPMSLAMCLFSLKYKHPVYYTQPKTYNTFYSRGIRHNDGVQDTDLYLVINKGNLLY